MKNCGFFILFQGVIRLSKMTNYEAWCGEEQIYNGLSKQDMINELYDYIMYQNHIDETQITEDEIYNLDEKALDGLGIKLYFAKW